MCLEKMVKNKVTYKCCTRCGAKHNRPSLEDKCLKCLQEVARKKHTIKQHTLI